MRAAAGLGLADSIPFRSRYSCAHLILHTGWEVTFIGVQDDKMEGAWRKTGEAFAV